MVDGQEIGIKVPLSADRMRQGRQHDDGFQLNSNGGVRSA